MKRTIRLVVLILLVTASSAAASSSHSAELHSGFAAQPELAEMLNNAEPNSPLVVFVTAAPTDRAATAAWSAGLTVIERFDDLGFVAAVGSTSAVRAVQTQPGVTRVDVSRGLTPLDDIAHASTGVAAIRDPATYPRLPRRDDGTPFDGSGISIAVVDTGFATTHEQFVEGGTSKFDVHLRQACPLPAESIDFATGIDVDADCSVWVPAGPDDDSVHSGHGTAVAATAAGYARTTPGGVPVSGVAPGARLVGLAIQAGGFSFPEYNAVSALYWVLKHHRDPCGDGSCPPIRVVNNSYGWEAEERRFDPGSPMSLATSALIRAGLAVVFGAGNDGGRGNTNALNYYALHPTAGMISVGAYDDSNIGDRDAGLTNFSSRGLRGDQSTYPDLVAPGILFTIACPPFTAKCQLLEPDGEYAQFGGTSGAAGYMSGVVALLLEANPSLTPADVEGILEDTAHQFGPESHLEADIYGGNEDHGTSFDAGHGLVDVVAALSTALRGGPPATAPSVCERDSQASITDPKGDAWALRPGGVRIPSLPSLDILSVDAGLADGALEAVVSLDDVAEGDLHAVVALAGWIDHKWFEVQFDRSRGDDPFYAFTGGVEVDGTFDTTADTVSFIIRPADGAVDERVSLRWAWTSYPNSEARGDSTTGACTLWVEHK